MGNPFTICTARSETRRSTIGVTIHANSNLRRTATGSRARQEWKKRVWHCKSQHVLPVMSAPAGPHYRPQVSGLSRCRSDLPRADWPALHDEGRQPSQRQLAGLTVRRDSSGQMPW